MKCSNYYSWILHLVSSNLNKIEAFSLHLFIVELYLVICIVVTLCAPEQDQFTLRRLAHCVRSQVFYRLCSLDAVLYSAALLTEQNMQVTAAQLSTIAVSIKP